jgi:hypothetical protein
MPAGEDLNEQRRMPSLPTRPRQHPCPPGKASFTEVLEAFLLICPHHAELIRERSEGLVISPDGSTIEGDWDLGQLGLEDLPAQIGSLRIQGDFSLQRNQIRNLPASFGSLIVGGSLYLDTNELSTLPASFGQLTVGGSLTLYQNCICTLPPSFPSLTVGGEVYLMDNPISEGVLILNQAAAGAATHPPSGQRQDLTVLYRDAPAAGSPEPLYQRWGDGAPGGGGGGGGDGVARSDPSPEAASAIPREMCSAELTQNIIELEKEEKAEKLRAFFKGRDDRGGPRVLS